MKKQEIGDALGEAVNDYMISGEEQIIHVHSQDVESYELPVSLLFRSFEEMPLLEQKALEHCRGKVLDVGAGTGCHAHVLQQKGFTVEALEISHKACEVMRQSGIQVVHEADFFHFRHDVTFDTLLLLMNGIGICGDLDGFRKFLQHAKKMLSPQGQIIFDTSDIIYLYQDQLYDLNTNKYYGTVSYQMEYNNLISDWFDWLYLDQDTLTEIAHEEGYSTNIIGEGHHYDYLVRLTPDPNKV